MTSDATPLRCSFCNKSQRDAQLLIEGPTALICDVCSDICLDLVDENVASVRRQLVTDLCRLTLKSVAGGLGTSDTQKLRDDIDDLANRIRGRRRERPGDFVAGYKLVRIVGSGNFANVWEGTSTECTPERAAVKIFDHSKLGMGLMLWRFQRGIRAMQHMTNMGKIVPPSVVRLHEIAPDGLAFAMDFLPGGDLQDLSERGWSLRKKLGVFVEVSRGVAFAHQVGVIHRDIKPANIVLTTQHSAVLTDFDIADIKFAATRSMQSASLGTPQFAAPEQLASKSLTADPAADVYSLGKLLYFMIAETAPPLGSTDPERQPAHLRAIPIPALRDMIAIATREDPAQRQLSVNDFIRITEQVITEVSHSSALGSVHIRPAATLSDDDIEQMVGDVAAIHASATPPKRTAEPAVSPKSPTDGAWFAGLAIGALGLLFFMILVIVSLTGVEVPPNSRFLTAVVLALTLAFSAGFLGGSASARGNFSLQAANEHPIRFAVTGGVATFVIVMALAYFMYL